MTHEVKFIIRIKDLKDLLSGKSLLNSPAFYDCKVLFATLDVDDQQLVFHCETDTETTITMERLETKPLEAYNNEKLTDSEDFCDNRSI